MNIGHIKIEYHPVKMEMNFYRGTINNRGQIAFAKIVSDNSNLKKYFHEQKGRILLQNLGETFFNDVFAVMNLAEKVIIDFKGTKIDYEDLRRMIEFFNKNHGEKFEIGEFIELPDVSWIYDEVKESSNEVILNFANDEQYIQGKIKESITNLKNKIRSLDKSDVNLCFVGAYSSGKSTLINAILGFAILPEAMNSMTAKIFKIMKPREGMPERVYFDLHHDKTNDITEMHWSNEHNIFRFHSGPDDNIIRNAIQDEINKNATERQHVQLQRILSVINEQSNNDADANYIKGVINVDFPIPLSENINFTIFDTPGTDSNNPDHLQVLEEALSEQSNSILVFVNAPNNTEGTGNAVLLQLLKSLETKKDKVTVDLGRSLYVINWADSLNEIEQFQSLQKSVIYIKNGSEGSDTDVCIDLEDKRLLFTSATAAYAAKAVMNKIQTEKEKKLLNKHRYSLVEDEDAGYYKYNKMALADHETEEIIKSSHNRCEKAKADKDLLMQYFVNSGVFALQNEIIKYGKKFALAVKTKGLVDGIESIIHDIRVIYTIMEENKKKEKDILENEIATLKTEVSDAIIKCCDELSNKKINPSDLIGLKIDEGVAGLYLQDAKEKINKITSFWYITSVDNKHRDLCRGLNAVIYAHKDVYIQRRKKTLTEKIDRLKEDVVLAIQNINGIDSNQKDYITNIPEIKIPDFDIAQLINFEELTKKSWFFDIKVFEDKSDYKRAMETAFTSEIHDRNKNYEANYTITLKGLCEDLKKLYLSNVESLAGRLKTAIEDKEKVNEELKWCSEKLIAINSINSKLINKIWGEER